MLFPDRDVITLISPQTVAKVNEKGVSSPGAAGWHWLVALLVLALLEVICFAPIIRHVGFYLDDWATVAELNLLTGDFFSRFTKLLVWDPRVTPRPVEALFFMLTYVSFGLKPLGWHILNQCLEVSGAFFFYMALFRLTARRTIALIAAATFLLYPSHDATHYWATCDAETFSTAFAMLSLWMTTLFAESKKPLHSLISIVAFNLAIYCYETLLPLVSLNIIFAALVMARRMPVRAAARRALIMCLPFVLSVVALLVYSRLIAPNLGGRPQVHAIVLSPAVMGTALGEGLKLNFPTVSVPFFFSQILQYYQRDGLTACLVAIALEACLTAAGLFVLHQIDKSVDQVRYDKPLPMVALGLYTIFISYTIFGLNPEYVPTLLTIVNRVNEGASVGVSMILAALLGWLATNSIASKHKGLAQALSCLTASLMIAFFALTNRGLAIPWMLSWQLQKAVYDSVSAQKANLKDGASVILANCPRYVMWAPLFDGVWDFQAVIRLAAGNYKLNGGVVSERLVISQSGLKDISRGVLCGQYDFAPGLYLLVAPRGDLIKIENAQHFVDTVKERGFGFGLKRSVLGQWQSQLQEEEGNGSQNQTSVDPAVEQETQAK